MPQAQPLAANWQTTNLVTTSPGLDPDNIIATNEAFDISVSFSGSGPIWTWLKQNNAQYRIQYFAESMGPGSDNRLLGVKVGNVSLAGGNNYGAPQTSLAINAPHLAVGVYRLACIVTFTNFSGCTGFFEGPPIEVHPPLI